jgi:hypothetical protein
MTDLYNLMDNKNTITYNESNSSGSVLIFVLIVITGMTALAVGCAYRTQIDIKLANAFARQCQTYYFALGGIERGIALITQQELTEDRVSTIAHFTSNVRTEQLFQQLPSNESEQSYQLSYRVCDEQSFYNINGQFANRFEFVVGREYAAAIIDWIDQDNECIGFEGAESGYYEGLASPYIASNKPLYALKELLFLKGVTLEGYLGGDYNVNDRLDESAVDRDAFFSVENGDGVLDPGLISVFTTVGDDRLNLNTVNHIVLDRIGGFDDPLVTNSIIAHRAGTDGILGTTDDNYFTKPEDIVIEGLTGVQQSILRDTSKFCYTSKFFRVYSHAKVDHLTQCTLIATIQIDGNQSRIVLLDEYL